MSLLAASVNIKGIADTIIDAAKKLNDPNNPLSIEDIGREMVEKVSSFLAPGNNDVFLSNLFQNGIDEKTKILLGGYAAVFRAGLEMSFSGVTNQNGPRQQNFSAELLKFIAPEALNNLEQQVFHAGLDLFRAWKN